MGSTSRLAGLETGKFQRDLEHNILIDVVSELENNLREKKKALKLCSSFCL